NFIALHYNNGLCYSRFIHYDLIRHMRVLIRLMRADEWWEYKLVPILSIFYATALVLHVSAVSMWIGALSLLLSIVMAAIYASVINELTDRADDAAAGKRNRATDRPRSIKALLAVTVCAGFCVCVALA